MRRDQLRPKNYAEATKASRTLALKAAMLDNARTFRCNRKDWGGRRKRRRKEAEEEEEEEGRGTPAQMHIRALERTTPCANRGRTLENSSYLARVLWPPPGGQESA
ncbi:unnamed protein product [Prorocentrum cordatum]|uniref:Uncharacterized protein n=1 Tax=Prorocentrum cordatum TaxID=2364126 RepID=A0ABN9S2I7_9DINO|nr:unnamed protein product [Polarella glacialis]